MDDMGAFLEEITDEDGRTPVRVCRIRRDKPDTPWEETKIVPIRMVRDRMMTECGLHTGGPWQIDCLAEMASLPNCMRGTMSFDRFRMEIAGYSVMLEWVAVLAKGLHLKSCSDPMPIPPLDAKSETYMDRPPML